MTLTAWSGHPEGRPWLAEVRVKVVGGAPSALATAFRYGEVDLAWEPVQGAPLGAAVLAGGWASWFAVMRPGLRTAERLGLRRHMATLAFDGRLARYVEGRGVVATSPWPDAFAPTSTGLGVVRSGDGVLTGLVIAYPDGDDELAELARALRDSLRLAASDNARVVAVARLTDAGAAADPDPIWDLAVVRHEWAALTRDQAAHELASLLGLPGLPVGDVLSGQTRRFADAVSQRVELLPLVHAPRGVLVKGPVRGIDASAGVPGLADSYRLRGQGAP